MPFDPRQTAAVHAVAETGSFEAAARQLHVTPSAISQRVRALETTMGGLLLTRTRPCHCTPLGQRLMQHLRRAALLDDDFAAELRGREDAPLRMVLAVNGDTLVSWFFPALAQLLVDERVLLDLHVDDQDHTHALMASGEAVGCVTTQPEAMRGCEAVALGAMRYRLMASQGFAQRWFPQGLAREAARRAPVVAATRKDGLHVQALQARLGLAREAFNCHYIEPPVPRFEAIRSAVGFGMVPELWLAMHPDVAAELVDLMPQHPTDVPLYWHGWKLQSPRLEQLSRRIVEKAGLALRPVAQAKSPKAPRRKSAKA